MDKKLSVVLLAALSAVLIAYFAVASLNPIYIDETVYHMLWSRYITDDLSRTFIYPQCPSTFLTAPPLLFQPAAVVISLLQLWIISPLHLRLFGLLLVGGNLLLVVLIFRKTIFGRDFRLEMELVAWCGIGTLPFLLAMARPEGGISFLLILSCYIALMFTPNKSRSSLTFIYMIVQLALATLMLWIHPLSVSFAPVLLLLLWKATSHNLLRLGLTSLLALLIWQAVSYHRAGYACPEVKELEEFFNNYSGGVVDGSVFSLQGILGRLETMVDVTPWIGAVLFKEIYPFGILPPTDPSSPILLLVGNFFVIMALGLALYVVLISLKQILTKKSSEFQFRHYLAIAVFLSILTFAALQPIKAPYRAELFFWLILLFTAVSVERRLFLEGMYTRVIRPFLRICILMSSLIGIMLFVRPTVSSLKEPMPKFQPISTGLMVYHSTIEDRQKALTKCKIDTQTAHNFLVDSVTYFSLRNSQFLALTKYALEGFPENKTAHQYLNDIGIRGVFIHCHGSPVEFDGLLQRTGTYCCWKNQELSSSLELP